MKPVGVIQVSRDEHGITYSDDETPKFREQPKAKPREVKVKTRKQAEKLGLDILVEQPEHLKDLGGGHFVQQPGFYSGAWFGQFRGNSPRSYNWEATTFEGLLSQFEAFMRRNQNE